MRDRRRQLLRAAAFTARAVRAPNRENTRRALPSKILRAILGAQPLDRLEVASRVVVVMAGVGIDAAHRADHLRGEQDVVGGHDLQQELDAGPMVDAGVEEDVLQQELRKRRPLHVLRDALGSGPSGTARRRRRAG